MMGQIIEKSYDFIVVGGGMSGVCASIAAARKGVKTALIQNRPVLGGMASSEHRMHICGADNHMSVPNVRETGILEEILLEHKRRNPETSYPIFDAVVWEKVHFQENLDLYLNTHMTEVYTKSKDKDRKITEIEAVQLTTEKKFRFRGTLFMDATGDGSLGAKAGALFHLGRESRDIYGESLAPEEDDTVTMGSSLMFQARDAGHPVPFINPSWAYTYTEDQLRMREHSEVTSGYWWIELGGTTHPIIEDGEIIRDELLKTIYGVWDHIKNGGDHGAENLELEWVGALPGKRESRRLIGDYVLTEKDCRKNTAFPDSVAYGGWSMDIHTVGGMLNEEDNPTVWNKVNGIYRIPYRCLYSANVSNLYLGGRAISCSHVAFSSTRVMATCAVTGQAAGTAAALAVKKNLTPREVISYITELQQELLRDDCYIPGLKNEDPLDLAKKAEVYSEGGTGAERIINGVGRAVGEESNCWKAPLKDWPELCLKWDSCEEISTVQLLFDSNLSREITPSISQRVLMRQSRMSPPELIHEYELEFFKEGVSVRKILRDSVGQRKQVVHLPEKVFCDELRIRPLNTYGSEDAVIFEVRAYKD